MRRRRRFGVWRAGCGLVLGLALPFAPARAMQVEAMSLTDGSVVLGARGPVVKGDTDRLRRALASIEPGRKLMGLAIDSPGGSVVEGSVFAAEIRARGLAVVVPAQSKCASVCFLIFAAANERVAGADALIGVHSASDDGEETATSMAVTTAMARAASAYGVPPAIVGKMVSTTPGRVEWLTRADLAAMHVRIYDERDVSLGLDGAGQAPAPAPPATPSGADSRADAPKVAQSDGHGAAVEEGRAARRAWDAWLAPLHGPYRDGASFAAAQRLASRPVPCEAMRLQPAGFVSGCNAAGQVLAPREARLAHDAEFRLGWMNATLSAQAAGLGAPARGASEGAAAAGAVVEFRGAMFCTGGASSLVLSVRKTADAERRQAVLSFGPTPTNPSVPSGSFNLEGVLDLNGRAVAMRPVSWVSPPRDWGMVGLVGASHDGGRTFEGQVVDSRQCSSFTLRRHD